ncbi:cell separation during budding [Pseudocyphellaria aurata]|nr:cell separation during budding [Pseudocyphellaria aurata]
MADLLSTQPSSASSRPSTDPRPMPSRTPSGRLRHTPSPSPGHRQSFTEQLRGLPPSPRATRHLSFSQAQMQELLNNPPTAGSADPAFAGRDWQHISVGELVNPKDLLFVELDTSVETATNLLTDSGAPVLLVRSGPAETSATATFDYRDLTQYLLFATGQLYPDEDHLHIFQTLAKKAQQGHTISLHDAKSLGNKEPFVTLPYTADLTKAVETFGGGVHRIVVVREGTSEVIGILSQVRLVKFLWENGASFPIIDQLYPQNIRELCIGSQHVISINGDKPLKEALKLMNSEGVTSLAVVDSQYNVVGNISNADVKHLTKSSSAPLLENTCLHFISVILSMRGMNDGKDSFPVFHVSPFSTLAHTVAKLVATKAHRMWIVDSPSPSPSAPPTPSSTHSHISHHPFSSPPPQAPLVSLSSNPSVNASSLPGSSSMSARLSGVVSLTDILNLYARASGLHPGDLEDARRKRRGSSSSSVSVSGSWGGGAREVRGSLDSARSNVVDVREKR